MYNSLFLVLIIHNSIFAYDSMCVGDKSHDIWYVDKRYTFLTDNIETK